MVKTIAAILTILRHTVLKKCFVFFYFHIPSMFINGLWNSKRFKNYEHDLFFSINRSDFLSDLLLKKLILNLSQTISKSKFTILSLPPRHLKGMVQYPRPLCPFQRRSIGAWRAFIFYVMHCVAKCCNIVRCSKKTPGGRNFC